MIRKEYIQNIVEYIINLLYPPRCIFCREIVTPDNIDRACFDCLGKIKFIDDKLFEKEENEFIDQIICVFEYSGLVKKSLKSFKFYDKPAYFEGFAKLLSSKIKKVTNYHKFDIIIPIPLHKEREKERGYNQSALISKILSKELDISFESSVLIRVKNTQTQSLLPKYKRKENISSAFGIFHQEKIRDKSIILVDDVITTGFTLLEGAKTLMEAGAKSVTCAVIASSRKY